MAKRGKVKAAASQDSGGGDDIFAHFAQHASSMGSEGGSVTKGEGNDDKTDTTALLARLDALERQNTELLTTQRLQLSAPAAASAGQDFRPDPKSMKLDLSGLPEQLEKPQEFQKELETRINAVMEAREYARTAETRQASEQTSASQQLWDGFKGAHPEWAAYQDLVGSVAAKVAQEKRALGIDASKYMFQNSSLFYADVVKALNDQYGALVTQNDDDKGGGQPAARRTARQADPNDDDGRTAGIFGGQESGGKPTRSVKDEGGSDMIEDLQKVQRAMGIF